METIIASTVAPSPIDYVQHTAAGVKNRAFARMQGFLNHGHSNAAAVISQVMTQVPDDRVVRAKALAFAGGDFLSVDVPGVGALGLHPHALEQLAGRAGIPTAFARELHGTRWGRELLAHNLDRMVQNTFGETDRLLTRTVGVDVRAVLSDRFRRIDARPDIEALLEVAKDAGAIPVNGVALDTKVSLKVALPRPLEVFPGEWMVFGLEYRNSDFGDGAKELRSFLLRLICLNGMTRETELRQVHLGARLNQDVAYSDATYLLDSQASASATKDLARHLLGTDRVTKMIESIRGAASEAVDAKARLATLQKTGRITKGEAARATEIYNTPDVETLPPGNTVWRFSNALSFMAQSAPDGYRQLELEKLAGEVLG